MVKPIILRKLSPHRNCPIPNIVDPNEQNMTNFGDMTRPLFLRHSTETQKNGTSKNQ
jgi:hypothetical protein